MLPCQIASDVRLNFRSRTILRVIIVVSIRTGSIAVILIRLMTNRKSTIVSLNLRRGFVQCRISQIDIQVFSAAMSFFRRLMRRLKRKWQPIIRMD